MAKKGRPFGTTTRPQFRNFITEDEVKKLVKIAKKQAETKPELLKFVLEQIFGKSVQPIGNDEDKPLRFQIVGMDILDESNKTPKT